MKKKISIIAIFIYVFVFFANALDVYAGTVNVNIKGNSKVKVNNTIDLTVSVSDIVGFTNGLATAQGDISFDNGYLEYQKFKKADSSPLSASYGTTTRRFVALGMSGEYIASSGDLITITFKAKQVGKTKVSVHDIVVGDTKAIVHSANASDKEIEIVNEDNTPNIPSTPSTSGGNNSDKGNKGGNTSSKTPSTNDKKTNKSSDNNLASLIVNNAKFSPTFSPSINSYNVIVSSGTTELDLSYTTSNPKATAKVVGNTGLKSGGNNVVQIIVTAEDGSKKTYTLNVEVSSDKSNNKLASLKVKESNLYPKFNSDVNEYTIKLKKGIQELTIDAIAADKNSKVEIIDNKNLDKNNSIVLIKVTDKNGFSNYYKLMVNSSQGGAKLFGIPVKYILIVLILLALFLFLLLLFYKRRKEDDEEEEDDLYDDVVTKNEIIGALEERDPKRLKMLLTQEEANKLKDELRKGDSKNAKEELIEALQSKNHKKVKEIMAKEKQNNHKKESYDEMIKDELIDAIGEKDTEKIKEIIKKDEIMERKKSKKR